MIINVLDNRICYFQFITHVNSHPDPQKRKCKIFSLFLLFIDYQLFTIHPSRVGAFTSKKQPISAFSNIFFHENLESEKTCLYYH